MAPGKKYPLLLKHKTSSFPSSDVQNSSFQVLQTTVPLYHKEKPGLDTHSFSCPLKNKDRDKLLPACSSSFPFTLHLVIHQHGRKWAKEIHSGSSVCSPNCPQQRRRWGHQSCLIRTPWLFDLYTVLFLGSAWGELHGAEKAPMEN